MGSLLSNTSSELPPEAVYLPSFISLSEEAALVCHLDAGEWNAELKRRVQHFGYHYDYRARTIRPDSYLGPVPEWLVLLGERLVAQGFLASLPDQVIANEYLPGQGISAHIDCLPCFDNTIVSVSLLSQCEMVFGHKRSGAKLAIVLEPCSAVVMSGAARYEWTHEIAARKSDAIGGMKVHRARRISLTFKTVVPALAG
ncbi:alpha-ketoglutarate-dependent dioxygenase AlkB [Hoeflea sp. AS60]|uniref:alpha-ketoglutarate-dependent dioxygenase AlkB n=1 Tax=Hoeflea sp. AS60 TaxID=3135780 RepID=UPI00316DD58C